MAIKTFGYASDVNNYYWGGVPYHANIGLRAVMPEDGKILSIKLKLARYSASDVPVVWGAIWNRNTGAKIAQSSNTVSPNTTIPTFADYVLNFPETFIAAGTPLWIGYGKISNEANRALGYRTRNALSGYYTDRNDNSQSSPASTFSVGTTYSNEAIWVEVTYKTGGQVKVWNGAAWAAKPAKVFNGSTWVEKVVKAYNGSWKESNS